ncbi:MAG: sigma-70 family RNA polymerase sigma factor [bacterium]
MRNKMKQDSIWVKTFLAGNQKGFDKLYKKYEKPLFSYIFKYTHNRETAEDVFQKTWFKAIRGLRDYKEQGSFGSWIFGIAHNNCIDHFRKSFKRQIDDNISDQGMDVLEDKITINPEEQLVQKEDRDQLKQAIKELPEEQKQVILLRLYGELPFKEIAEKCECSINTVLGRMHYAVRNLKKMARNHKWEGLENDGV